MARTARPMRFECRAPCQGRRVLLGLGVCSGSIRVCLPVSIRAVANIVLLAVLALRSLLPAGYMVQVAAASGAPEIVICTSAGQKLIAAEADGTPAPARPQSVDTGLCPFAAAGAAALAAAEPRSLVGEAEYASVTYTMAVAVFAETPKPGATSARGPPPSASI